MKTILLAIASTLLCFCAQTQPVEDSVSGPATDSLQLEMIKQKKAVAAQFAKVQLTYLIIKVENERYGYYILADGEIIIEQKTIPALPINKGFELG